MAAERPLSGRRAEALRAASRTLAELLDAPEVLALLEADRPLPDATSYLEAARSAATASLAELRSFKRRSLLEIAARDVCGELSFEASTAALSDLADACLNAGLEAMDPQSSLAVIAMGKLGGRELNYASDIDVIFVTDEDVPTATKVAERLVAELGGVTPQGQAFRIDVDLRPEGRAGPLVRSLDSCREYYDRWAEPWEYQALIKARASAGDLGAGERFVAEISPRVYSREVSPDRVASIRAMKARVEEHAGIRARRGRSEDGDNVKLGPGGIRDVEFSIQLLQLVHGGADPNVRSPSTLDALRRLVEGGYVADDDGAGLAVAYRWLRTVEHRLQLWQERQVHVLPKDEVGRARMARGMGFKDSPDASAVARFEAAHNSILMDVRTRFEKLFYRPMIESLSEAPGARLSEAALRERLRVLGFRDVERATRTLGGLVSGTSRRARLFRVITPALLRWLAKTPLPDEGLLWFLRIGEVLEARPDILGRFRDNPPGLEFLARVLGSGRLLGEHLIHVPEEMSSIADPAGAELTKPRERLVHEAVVSLEWRDPEDRMDGIRRFKRREVLRIALWDLGGRADVDEVGSELTDLAEACLEAALEPAPSGFAVIAMGKLGGRELTYASDIDVVFLHELDPGAAEKRAEELVRTIGEMTPEGQAFRIDADLRPEGKAGSLARSFGSFLEYEERWARPWEHLALLKARHAAGDQDLSARWLAEMTRHSFPSNVAEPALAEIRHLKARMEKERIPRGTDRRRNLKLGPGGMSDVEFAAQLLQFQHAHEHHELRVTGTREALEALSRVGLLPEDEVRVLLDAYSFLARLRNRLFWLFARPVEVLPVKPEDLEAAGVAMGYEDQPRQQLEEDYLRVTRRARRTAERVIYGSA